MHSPGPDSSRRGSKNRPQKEQSQQWQQGVLFLAHPAWFANPSTATSSPRISLHACRRQEPWGWEWMLQSFLQGWVKKESRNGSGNCCKRIVQGSFHRYLFNNSCCVQVEVPRVQPKLSEPFLGFTQTAEIWNSRACMMGLIGTFIVELVMKDLTA